MQAGLLQIIPQAAIFSNESNPYQFVRAKNNLYVWIFACDVRVMCVDKKWDVWGSTRTQSMATHNGRGQADVGQPTKLLPTMCWDFQATQTIAHNVWRFSIIAHLRKHNVWVFRRLLLPRDFSICICICIHTGCPLQWVDERGQSLFQDSGVDVSFYWMRMRKEDWFLMIVHTLQAVATNNGWMGWVRACVYRCTSL